MEEKKKDSETNFNNNSSNYLFYSKEGWGTSSEIEAKKTSKHQNQVIPADGENL